MKEFKTTPVKSSILNVYIDKIKDKIDNIYNDLSYKEIIEINKRINKEFISTHNCISHNYTLNSSS